jgi:hypothetical protein
MTNEFDNVYARYYDTIGSQKDFCQLIWNAAISAAQVAALADFEEGDSIYKYYEALSRELKELKIEIND